MSGRVEVRTRGEHRDNIRSLFHIPTAIVAMPNSFPFDVPFVFILSCCMFVPLRSAFSSQTGSPYALAPLGPPFNLSGSLGSTAHLPHTSHSAPLPDVIVTCNIKGSELCRSMELSERRLVSHPHCPLPSLPVSFHLASFFSPSPDGVFLLSAPCFKATLLLFKLYQQYNIFPIRWGRTSIGAFFLHILTLSRSV